MKPFDLEQAKAGKPVITRSGKDVTQLVLFENVNHMCCLHGVVDKELLSWWPVDGRYSGGSIDGNDDPIPNSYDLFMATEKKTVWVNVYKNSNGNIWIGNPHETEQSAKEDTKPNHQHLKTISIEIEL